MSDKATRVAKTQWISIPEFLADVPRKRNGAGDRIIGRDVIYQGIRDGVIPHIRMGRKLLIPADLLDRLEDLTGGTPATTTAPDLPQPPFPGGARPSAPSEAKFVDAAEQMARAYVDWQIARRRPGSDQPERGAYVARLMTVVRMFRDAAASDPNKTKNEG